MFLPALKLLDYLKNNWRALALRAAALLIAGLLFYMWAYERGKSACEAAYATANLKAVNDSAKANQDALAKELSEREKRVRKHEANKQAIEGNNHATDDDPAPAIDQLFYDRLRGAN